MPFCKNVSPGWIRAGFCQPTVGPPPGRERHSLQNRHTVTQRCKRLWRVRGGPICKNVSPGRIRAGSRQLTVGPPLTPGPSPPKGRGEPGCDTLCRIGTPIDDPRRQNSLPTRQPESNLFRLFRIRSFFQVPASCLPFHCQPPARMPMQPQRLFLLAEPKPRLSTRAAPWPSSHSFPASRSANNARRTPQASSRAAPSSASKLSNRSGHARRHH